MQGLRSEYNETLTLFLHVKLGKLGAFGPPRQPPIQVHDALARSLPAELESIVAHCLAYGRRQSVEVVEHCLEQCRPPGTQKLRVNAS